MSHKNLRCLQRHVNSVKNPFTEEKENSERKAYVIWFFDELFDGAGHLHDFEDSNQISSNF